MDYLGLWINWSMNLTLTTRCEKFKISHLMFADDLLLFARADAISLAMIMDKFSDFSKVSGLDKSFVYIGGVSGD